MIGVVFLTFIATIVLLIIGGALFWYWRAPDDAKDLIYLITSSIAAWAEPAPAPAIVARDVEAAVYQAFVDCGQPIEQWSREFDLARAGKLGDVLLLAARRLDRDEFRTVEDVIDVFVRHSHG